MFVYSDRDRDTPTRDCVVVSSWADVQCWRRECEPMLLPAASGATGRPCALSRPVRYVLTADPRSAPRARRLGPRNKELSVSLGACVPVEVTAFGFRRPRSVRIVSKDKTPETESNVTLKILWLKSQPGVELPATRRPQPACVSRRGKVASSPGRRAVPRRPAARSSGNTMY